MHTDNTKHLTGEQLIRMDDYKKPLGNKIVKGNEYVRLTVLIADFVLLNLLMWVALETMGSWVPEYFDRFTKITVMVMNFSMLISEYYFRTIIHKRLLRTDEVVGNVGKLVTMQAVTMFVLLRLLSDGGGFFRFMLVFTPRVFCGHPDVATVGTLVSEKPAKEGPQQLHRTVCGQRQLTGPSV